MKPTPTPKPTHIGKRRARYALNQRCIRVAFNWDEDNYNNQWLDMGLAFLAERYPPQNAKYVDFYRSIRNDRRFWKWWLAEWKQKEDSLLKVFGRNLNGVTKEYSQIMNDLPSLKTTEVSYTEQYLSHIKLKQ